jgi:hypothetical protein
MMRLASQLDALGFSLGEEIGLAAMFPSGAADPGTFCHCALAGERKTIAFDEDGDLWVGNGQIDLTSRGFKPIKTIRR